MTIAHFKPCGRRAVHAVAFCALIAVPIAAIADSPPASWQLGYKATGYAYQNAAQDGTTSDVYQSFHAFSGSASGLAGGLFTVRGAGRFAGGPDTGRVGYQANKISTGILEARLTPHMKAQAGRQFLQAGVASLTLDGLLVNYRSGRSLDFTAWGGARSPLDLGFEAGTLDQDAAAGGRVVWRPAPTWRVGVSGAYQERLGVVAARPVGAELMSSSVPNTRLFGRVAYDLEQDQWSRVQAQAQWRRGAGSPVIDLQYIDRTPTIDAASWFARFTDLKRIRLARAAVRYERPSRFGGELEYVGSFVGGLTSSRVGVAALVPGGRVGYSVRLGDAGEENRLYGEFGRDITRHLWLGAEASLLTYALMQDAPADQERDLTTLAARARLALRPGLRVLAEVQSLDNPFYRQDVRFLVGLDVSMARGSSRLGLDRGGWLQ